MGYREYKRLQSVAGGCKRLRALRESLLVIGRY